MKKIKVFFHMVDHPAKGWIRVGRAYESRHATKGWVSFIRARYGWTVKISQCTICIENDQVCPKSIKILNDKYNMDAPLYIPKTTGEPQP